MAANTGVSGTLTTAVSSGLGGLAPMGVAIAAIAALPSILKAATGFVGPQGLGGSIGGQVVLGSVGLSLLFKSVMGGAGGSFLGFSEGGIVPAAAGGWQLPASFGSDRVLSALTPGETVLPRGERPSSIFDRLSAQIDAAAAGGGTTTTNIFNIRALDGRSVAQLIASQPDAIATGLARARRNFSGAGR